MLYIEREELGARFMQNARNRERGEIENEIKLER